MTPRPVSWTLCAVLTLACAALPGCSKEPGHIRVSRDQLFGSYQIPFKSGIERLELKSDGTYIQDFISRSRAFSHTGIWSVENHFLGGTDVILSNAAISEEDGSKSISEGECRLSVHNRSGRLALARNESADWYYERLQ